jgi:hypothetical protein
MRRLPALIALALVAALLGATPAAADTVTLRPSFLWSMQPRFGLDADADGLIDHTNTTEYVHNRHPGSCSAGCPDASFAVTLDASRSRVEGAGFEVRQYRWVVAGGGMTAPLAFVRTSPRLDLLLPEGTYRVGLTVLFHVNDRPASARIDRIVEVDDLLVVAIGDSYASGEGNPEVRRTDGGVARWADSADPLAAGRHEAARRSTIAWPARTALLLERRDPHSSVTFVSVASSGATVGNGVLGAQGDLPAQIDQVRRLVGDRDIDLLLVSIGGNDIGFARIVRGLVDADPQMDPVCYDTDLDNVWLAAADGDWRRSSSLSFDIGDPLFVHCKATGASGPVLPGLIGLGAELDRLADELEGLGGRVAIMEYPDPTGGGRDDGLCDEIVGDATPPLRFHEIDRLEQLAGMDRVLGPLNEAIGAAAARHGWTVVGGVSEAFGGHGYCADWPDYGYPDSFWNRPSFMRKRLDHPDAWYRNPGASSGALLLSGHEVTWYRSAGQSAVLQGPDRLGTTGTMHPNELGHTALAALAFQAIRAEGD